MSKRTTHDAIQQAHTQPVSRGLVVLLAILLAFQLRSDRLRRSGEGPWEGDRGLYLMSEVRRLIRERHADPPDDRLLFLGAVRGMVESLDDPYSEYIPPQAGRLFLQQMDDERLGGIGVEFAFEKGRGLRILGVLPGGAADRAEIRPGDLVVAVDGLSIESMALAEARQHILGRPGSPVRLEVVSRDGRERSVTLIRQSLPRMWMYIARMLPGDLNIGYLRFQAFAHGVAAEAEASLRELERQGMRGLVLDLRRNPGGAIEEAFYLAGLFLPADAVVTVLEGRDTRRADRPPLRQTHLAPAESLGDYPVVVLADGTTASASELLIAALQDHGRAVVVGAPTYGKARVQEFIPLEDGAGFLKLTTARYLTPNGKDINGVGVAPDIPVSMDEDAIRAAFEAQHRQIEQDAVTAEFIQVDPQLRAAVEHLRSALSSASSESE